MTTNNAKFATPFANAIQVMQNVQKQFSEIEQGKKETLNWDELFSAQHINTNVPTAQELMNAENYPKQEQVMQELVEVSQANMNMVQAFQNMVLNKSKHNFTENMSQASNTIKDMQKPFVDMFNNMKDVKNPIMEMMQNNMKDMKNPIIEMMQNSMKDVKNPFVDMFNNMKDVKNPFAEMFQTKENKETAAQETAAPNKENAKENTTTKETKSK